LLKKGSQWAWSVYARAHLDLIVLQSDAVERDFRTFDDAKVVYQARPGQEEDGAFFIDLTYKQSAPTTTRRVVMTVGGSRQEATVRYDPVTAERTPFSVYRIGLDRLLPARSSPLHRGQDVEMAVLDVATNPSVLFKFSLDGATFRQGLAFAGPAFARALTSAGCRNFRANKR
jgi:hypothetical protein